MSRCGKLLARARRNPSGLRFEELVRLAECYEFRFSRQRGSHLIYRHSGLRTTISLQAQRGMAKDYQVKQVLELIEEIGGAYG